MTKVQKAIELQREATKLWQECLAEYMSREQEAEQEAEQGSLFIEPDPLSELTPVQALSDMAKEWAMEQHNKREAMLRIKAILGDVEKFGDVEENSETHKRLDRKIKELV